MLKGRSTYYYIYLNCQVGMIYMFLLPPEATPLTRSELNCLCVETLWLTSVCRVGPPEGQADADVRAACAGLGDYPKP